MDTEPNKYWKDICVSEDLIGDTITKGSGMWEKEYRYIKVPDGYGYDNYVFLLSEKLVEPSSDNKTWYFTVCDDMKIELFYSPNAREEGKRYSRYKMTGQELIERIFEEYEVNLYKECEERLKAERAAKEKRDRANIGNVVCGRYYGNIYGNFTNNYTAEDYLACFFRSKAGTYSNHKFQKVHNVKCEFTIRKMSKYHFLRFEEIINEYICDYEMYKRMEATLTGRLVRSKKIVTHTESIAEEHLSRCRAAIEEVKKKLQERLDELLGSSEN